MNKAVRKFLVEKVVAIALILFGGYLMVCRIDNVLPFGWKTENIAVWGVWAYLGLIISGIVIAAGICLFLLEAIDSYFNKLNR